MGRAKQANPARGRQAPDPPPAAAPPRPEPVPKWLKRVRGIIAADPELDARVGIDHMRCDRRGNRAIHLYGKRGDGTVTALALAMESGATAYRARVVLYDDECPACRYVRDNYEVREGETAFELSWKRVPDLVWGAIVSLKAA